MDTLFFNKPYARLRDCRGRGSARSSVLPIIFYLYMPKMTKAQIVGALADKIGMSKVDTKRYLDALYDLAISEVKKSGQFVVANLGKLVKVHRAERMGRNP